MRFGGSGVPRWNTAIPIWESGLCEGGQSAVALLFHATQHSRRRAPASTRLAHRSGWTSSAALTTCRRVPTTADARMI
jgi:hypothetical protein